MAFLKKHWLLLTCMAVAVVITEMGNRTASESLSLVSVPGWKVATVVWPAGIHEGTLIAAMGSIIVAFVVNVAVWTLVLIGVWRLLSGPVVRQKRRF